MRNFERQGKSRKILESLPALIILGILVLIFAWSVLRFWHKMQMTAENRERAEAKAQILRTQKITLESDIQKLETVRGKEEFFRQNYGLAKEGEEVIIIVEDDTLPVEDKPGGLSGFFSRFINWWK